MPTFEYTAVNAEGQSVSGTVLGSSLDQAVGSLSRQGLQIEKIGVAATTGDPLSGLSTAESSRHIMGERSYVATSVVGAMIDKVPLKELMFFFRQFATMQKAGVPVVQSLDTLATQTRDGKLSGVIKEFTKHVEAGRPISYGMQRYPEVFSPLMVSLVRAGEEGGFVEGAFTQLAAYMEQEIELRNLYRKAMFMPKLTIFSSIIIILAANAIINAVAPEGMRIWSPLTQPITWLYLGPICVGIYMFFTVGMANPRIKYGWDRFLLKVPYLGVTVRQLAMAKFGRAFGVLYAGGVAIPRCIELAADACGNEFMRAELHPASKRLEEGSTISETLASTNALSPIVLDMVHTGETTGNMDAMLTKMAEFYEGESKVRSEQLGRVAGVTAIVIVGIYVGIIVVKFWGAFYGGVSSAGASGDGGWLPPFV